MSQENSCAKRVNFELMGVDNKHPLEQNFENYNETDPMHAPEDSKHQHLTFLW